jgi:hypothetical protein
MESSAITKELMRAEAGRRQEEIRTLLSIAQKDGPVWVEWTGLGKWQARASGNDGATASRRGGVSAGEKKRAVKPATKKARTPRR